MSTLFPEYGDERHRPARHCCSAWFDITRDEGDPPPWAWQVIHEIAHGRVPFTVSQLAAIGQIDPAWTEEIVGEALKKTWVVEVNPESYMTEPTVQYVGHLPRKR